MKTVIRQKQVDLVVLGTHGRGGLGKVLLGSIAEQIFRHADCFVVTVGPGSYKDSLVEKAQAVRPFLFATDFGAASLHALPYAISFASHFGAKLIVLHVLPAAPIPEGFHWSTTGNLRQIREEPSGATSWEWLNRCEKPSRRRIRVFTVDARCYICVTVVCRRKKNL
jgi:nucleotide-binding universal stress UspA family protein